MYKIELDPFAMDVKENIVEIYAHLLLLDCETGREISRCSGSADYFILRSDAGPLFVDDGRTRIEQAEDIIYSPKFRTQGEPYVQGHALRLDFDVLEHNDIVNEMKASAKEPVDEDEIDLALEDWYDGDTYDEFRDMFDEMKERANVQ